MIVKSYKDGLPVYEVYFEDITDPEVAKNCGITNISLTNESWLGSEKEYTLVFSQPNVPKKDDE